jgi:hypothetical protein
MAFPIPAYATQPLQAPYVFDPNSFAPFTGYIHGQASNHNGSPYRACPVVATYSTGAVRNQAIATALPEAVPHYQAGVAVSSATRYYPSGQGGVGVVVSPMQNAAGVQMGLNDWHAVGVLRQKQTMWIQDPAYVTGSQDRLPNIPGTSNVTRLLNSHGFGAVNQIQVQGLGDTSVACMGRSAQFMDNVIGAPSAVAPYPPNYFVPNVVTPGWQVVARY